ncbi:MAG: hypothetical protein Q7T26_12260 [Dehalococcoidia bacterium]|nr:hypothetical protein [Dehalococcoidia bacterium]
MQPDDGGRAEQEALVEGLVHLADMLEVADPRRGMAGSESGGGHLTLADWRARCRGLLERLSRARPALPLPEQRAALDEALGRIRHLLDS